MRSEDDILIAVAGSLIRQGWTIRQVSPFPWSAREHVERDLLAQRLDVGAIWFERHGCDIVAKREGVAH